MPSSAKVAQCVTHLGAMHTRKRATRAEITAMGENPRTTRRRGKADERKGQAENPSHAMRKRRYYGKGQFVEVPGRGHWGWDGYHWVRWEGHGREWGGRSVCALGFEGDSCPKRWPPQHWISLDLLSALLCRALPCLALPCLQVSEAGIVYTNPEGAHTTCADSRTSRSL
jgi:hypothetical protein